jgi:hypothetical protein
MTKTTYFKATTNTTAQNLSRGSGRVGRLFGPVMAAWFVVLGLAGITHALTRPGVLVSLDPRYALAYVKAPEITAWLAITVAAVVSPSVQRQRVWKQRRRRSSRGGSTGAEQRVRCFHAVS